MIYTKWSETLELQLLYCLTISAAMTLGIINALILSLTWIHQKIDVKNQPSDHKDNEICVCTWDYSSLELRQFFCNMNKSKNNLNIRSQTRWKKLHLLETSFMRMGMFIMSKLIWIILCEYKLLKSNIDRCTVMDNKVV